MDDDEDGIDKDGTYCLQNRKERVSSNSEVRVVLKGVHSVLGAQTGRFSFTDI